MSEARSQGPKVSVESGKGEKDSFSFFLPCIARAKLDIELPELAASYPSPQAPELLSRVVSNYSVI